MVSAALIVPTLLDLASTPVRVSRCVSCGLWSLKVDPPRLSESSTVNTESGPRAPSSSTAAIVITLLVLPGSNTSLTARLPRSAFALAAGLAGSKVGAVAIARISPVRDVHARRRCRSRRRSRPPWRRWRPGRPTGCRGRWSAAPGLPAPPAAPRHPPSGWPGRRVRARTSASRPRRRGPPDGRTRPRRAPGRLVPTKPTRLAARSPEGYSRRVVAWLKIPARLRPFTRSQTSGSTARAR